MEYQKIRKLFNNTPDQPSKLKTRNLVKINNGSCGTYSNNNRQINS